MADTSWNLGVNYDTSGGTLANSSAVNAGGMALLTNKSGGALTTGDVVVQLATTDEAVTTTTTAGDLRPVFVVPQNITGNNTAATKSVAADADAWFWKPGSVVPAANVDGAVSIGEYLKTSTTAKKLTGTDVTIGASTVRPVGACAVALEDATGAGTIKVLLLGVTESFGIADKTEKTAVVGDDLVIIADSEASNALKKVKLSNATIKSYCVLAFSGTLADAATNVSWTSEVADTDDYANLSTDATKLIAPTDGIYNISCNLKKGGGVDFIAYFKKNGTTISNANYSNDTLAGTQIITATLYLAADDYIQVTSDGEGGTATSTTGNLVIVRLVDLS